MSHTVETRTTYTDVMHEMYEAGVERLIPERSLFLKKLQTIIPTDGNGGKQFNLAVEYNSMGGVGSLAESDSLPQSLPGNFDNAVIPFNWHYFVMSISGQLMATSEGAYAAVPALTKEIDTKTTAFAQMINRQVCGDGNAILCQADGDDDGAGNVTVDNAGGWSGFNGSAVNGHRYLSINQYIFFRDSSGTARTAGVKITGITPGAYPATSAILALSGTSTDIADGDYAYQAASTTASNDAYGHEMPGVKLLVDDNTVAATVQGISADTYYEWRSNVGYGATPGTAEALTKLRMNDLYSRIMFNGGNTNFIAASPAVWTTYGALGDNNNIIMNAKEYDVAYPALAFNGVPVFQDPYLADEMYFIDTSSLAFYQAMPAGWLDFGQGAFGQTTDKDEMVATWKWYLTMAIKNRAKNGKMVDITVLSNQY